MNNKQYMYYSRLCKLGTKQPISITLNEVAETMFTSMRHSRTLLKEMVQNRWLTWEPKVGRNQRSTLFLRYDEHEVQTEIAKILIKKGKYEKALALVKGDQNRFGQLLEHTSGTSWREDRLHIQLTYPREFLPLLPHKPLRNAERFLMRQIYACLTSCDAKGNISPQLAHHWSYNEKELTWTFYLRPQLTFHNGETINAQTIADLFNQLKTLPRYTQELAHIECIETLHPLCITFKLAHADPGFAGLLADIKYSIQPVSQLYSAPQIVGSGIFQIHEFSNQRLQLHAFDCVYTARSLTDTVTIWQIPNREEKAFGATSIQPDITTPKPACSNHLYKNNNNQGRLQTRIEDGCLLMMINKVAKLSLLQRKYLTHLLSSDTLMSRVNSLGQINATTAYNLLPDWVNAIAIEADIEAQPLPSQLSIAIYEHPALEVCAQTIAKILEKVNIKCNIHSYTYQELYSKAYQNQLCEDLLLTSLNLDDNKPSSVFCWLLSDALLHQSLSTNAEKWLNKKLRSVRSQKQLAEYLDEIEILVTALINEHWLMPMFHHRQILHFEDILKGISMNVWGWPNFQYVWSENQH